MSRGGPSRTDRTTPRRVRATANDEHVVVVENTPEVHILSEEELTALVTGDAMVGVARVSTP